jgi:hypothetical protein
MYWLVLKDVSLMFKRFIFLFFLGFLDLGTLGFGHFNVLQAQVFLPPKSIKNYLQTKMIVASRSDLKVIQSNILAFKHIEVLKVQGAVDIAEVAKVASTLDGLEEVQLIEFQGILSDADIQSLEWIPSIYLHVPANREEAFLLNSAWKYLQNVTLHFQSVPESWEFLSYWKSLKSLILLGDFDAETTKQCINAAIVSSPKLISLGISVSSVRDIPIEIKKIRKLKSLTVIDFTSIEQGQSLLDLGEMVYRFPKITVKYESATPTLSSVELEYLQKLFHIESADIPNSTVDEDENHLDFVSAFDFGIANKNLTHNELVDIAPNKKDNYLKNYSNGRYVFIGNSDKTQRFLGDQRLAVIVPKGAFSQKDKAAFNGDYLVDIRFAQSEDERAANGLSTSNPGSSPIFNSVGVVDIRFYEINTLNELNVRDGYFIQLRFIGSKSDAAQFYAWNSLKQKWENHYDYDYEFSDEQLQKIDFYQIAQQPSAEGISVNSERINLEECFEHFNYAYLIPPHKTALYFSPFPKFWVRTSDQLPAGTKEFRKILRGKPLIQVRTIPAPSKSFVYLQLFDRTQVLFPELKSFEELNLALKTDNGIAAVKTFFKDHRIIDIQIYRSNGLLTLNLKCTDGYWSLNITEPKDLPFLNNSEKLTLQKKFESALTKYLNIQSQKALALKNLNEAENNSQVQISSSFLLGSAAAVKSPKKRYEFSIRSAGTFMMASPDTISSEYRLELVFCETGKIPLKVKDVIVSLNKPTGSVAFSASDRYRLPFNPSQIEMILVRDQKNRIYGIGGDELQKLQLAPYTLTYIDMRLIPGDINTPELLYKILLQKPKKSK